MEWRDLVRTAGVEMMRLSQAGVPPARSQQELTRLQRKALLEALALQDRETERQYRNANPGMF